MGKSSKVAAAAAAEVTRGPIVDGWFTSLEGRLKPVRISILYRLGLLVVATAMVLLPLIYLGLIALVGYGVYYHAFYNISLFDLNVRGRGMLLLLVVYVAPLVAGPIAMFFMVKPFLARRVNSQVPLSLEPRDEPVLFRFVEALCRKVGAPVPKRIDVDCQVNASAALRRGVWSMFGNDLVLTVGLPLAATMNLRQFTGVLAHEFGHFAQGGAMRLTYMIRSINHWFAHVVYGRDAWDAQLDDAASQSNHWAPALIIVLTRVVIWLSRRVLWLLMWIGESISCFMLRQMEYDADRYSARLTGSDVFVSVEKKLPLIELASRMALEDLRQSFSEGKLADNLPALVEYHLEHLPDGPRKQIEHATRDRKTQLLATHPASRDRIASVKRETTAGDFRFKDPAGALFRDFDRLCVLASSFQYKQMLGEQYARISLRPTAEILRARHAEEQVEQAAKRFFQGALSWREPIWLDSQLLDVDPEETDWRDQLRTARVKLERLGADAARAQMQLAEADERLRSLRRAWAFMATGAKVDAGSYGLRDSSRETVRGALREANTRRGQGIQTLQPARELARQRLEAAVGLLMTADCLRVDKIEGMRRRVRRFLPAIHLMGEQHETTHALREHYEALIVLLQGLTGHENDEAYIFELTKRRDQLVAAMHKLRMAFKSTRYPFDHAGGAKTIGEFLAPVLPPADDLGQVIGVAEQMLDRYFNLYHRLMCWLAWMGERVEAALGMDASPDLKPISDEAAVTDGA